MSHFNITLASIMTSFQKFFIHSDFAPGELSRPLVTVLVEIFKEQQAAHVSMHDQYWSYICFVQLDQT